MIIDKGLEIVTAFENNKVVMDWIYIDEWEIPNISVDTTPTGMLPALIVTLIGGQDNAFSDNEVMRTDIRYQITVLSEDGSDIKVASEVDNEMRKIGFFLYNNYPLYNKETKLYQRVMLYRGQFEE